MPAIFFYVIIALSAVFLFTFLLNLLFRNKRGGKRGKAEPVINRKERAAKMNAVNKRLAKNPKDTEALAELGNLHYDNQEWDKAFRAYSFLLENHPKSISGVSIFDVYARHGTCAMNLKRHSDAYKSLSAATRADKEYFEVNYNLGFLEFKRKNYQNAVGLLAKARTDRPMHTNSQKYFGLCQIHLNNSRVAAEALKAAHAQDPEDKEVQYNLAIAYSNIHQREEAAKLLMPLCYDPVYGPRSALSSGILYGEDRKFESAASSYTIGLQHASIPPDLEKELRYRLALLLIETGKLKEALVHLQKVSLLDGQYKDVSLLIKRYKDVSSNQNLQIYMLGEVSEFVSLCRKICAGYYKKSKVKISSINTVSASCIDIVAEISTRGWEDTAVFRFIRGDGKVGDLPIRELYAKMKDGKAGRGVFMSPGEVSDGGKQFVEARLIDIVDEDKFKKKLQSI